MKKALIAFGLLLVCLLAFLWFRETWLFTIALDGFVYPGDEAKTALINGGQPIDYDAVPVSDSDEVYTAHREYYVDNGESRSKISISLPLVSRDGERILLLDDGSEAITSKYESISTFRGAVIADGIMYNIANNDQVDHEQYIFLKNSDNLFVNISKITIHTSARNLEIPKGSLIFFEKNILRYYSLDLDNAKYHYHEMTGIDLNDNVKILTEDQTYKSLLQKLKIWHPEAINDDETDISDENDTQTETNPTAEESHPDEVPTQSQVNTPPQSNTGGYNGGDGFYVDNDKLEVRANFVSADIYSATFSLYIHDPKNEIVRYPTVEIFNGSTVYSRKTFYSTNTEEITMLLPETTYKYQIYYIYRNEDGKQIRSTLDEGEFTTGNMSSVESIAFTYDNVTPHANDVTISNLNLSNDKNDKVLKGLQKVTAIIDGQELKLSSGLVASLTRLEPQTYTTPSILKSNTFYRLELRAYDVAGHQLSVTNSEIDFRTTKIAPSVKLSLEDHDFTWFKASVQLTNPDNVTITNFHYVVLDGKTIIRESAIDSSLSIHEKDLSDGKIYHLLTYADFDLGDGAGTRKDQLLAEMNITTASISVLGNLRLALTKNLITKDSADFNLEINSRTTDSRLIKLLDSLTINLTDEADQIIKSISLSTDALESLKRNDKFPLVFNDLPTNTKYNLSGVANIKQGDVEYPVDVILDVRSFQTFKEPAVAEMINKLATPSMIDYSVRIVDTDGAITSDRILMEIRRFDGGLVGVEELEINGDYSRFNYNKLDSDTRYIVSFLAEGYNEGFTDITSDSGHKLGNDDDYTFYTDKRGIDGSIYLESLLREQLGKNHYEIDNLQRWKSTDGNSTTTDRKYDLKENATIFSAKNGRRTYAYYVPELANQQVSISFEAKYQTPGSQLIPYVANGDGNQKTCAISNLTTEYQKYTSCTFKLNAKGYIGFNISEEAASNILTEVSIKNLQIEQGSTATEYEPFQSKVDEDGDKVRPAITRATITDPRSEIDNGEYYVKLYRFGEWANQSSHPLGDNHTTTEEANQFDVKLNSNYTAKLIVYVNGVDYEISSVDFTTEEEIRLVRNLAEFKAMHANGKYVIVNDLDFRNETSTALGGFYGTIDFQGHKMLMDVQGAPNALISSLYGTLRNVDIHLYYNNPNGRTYFWGLTEYNFGNLENLMVTVEESTNVGNVQYVPLSRYNYGVIDNFLVHLKTTVYGIRQISALVYCNYNIIRNGYLYADEGKSITALYDQYSNENPKLIGAVSSISSGTSRLENVYSLIDVNSDVDKDGNRQFVGNLVGRGDLDSTITHVYSNANGENRSPDRDANWVHHGSYAYASYENRYNIKDSYYVSDNTYTDQGSIKISPRTLRDATFQDYVLNTYGAFDVSHYVSYGYYPHLNFPESMPNQPYLALSNSQESEEADVTSVLNVEHRGNNVIDITLKFHNPYARKITAIDITSLGSTEAGNITIDTEKQFDYNGTSEVYLTVTNPQYYYSAYSIASFQHEKSLNASFTDRRTKTYNSNEKLLNIEIFKDVSSVQDWTRINASDADRRQNYRLTQDLDFNQVAPGNLRIQNFRGKLNGENHTVRNITISSGEAVFNSLYGAIENLFVDNYTQSALSNRGGFINTAQTGSSLNGVHLSNVHTLGNEYIGSLVGYAVSSTIQNSSVSNFTLENITATYNEAILGGLVGGIGGSTIIQNCFAQNVDLDIRQSPNIYTVGGLVGKINGAGTVENVYTTGTIRSKTPSNGGIIGWVSSHAILRNAYANVDIYSASNVDIGGITGEVSVPSYYSISNTLSVGAIYSSLSEGTVRRILGGDITINQPNFAWHDQHINGLINENTSGEILLSTADLNQPYTYTRIIELGNAFNYDELGDNSLPRLYTVDHSAILIDGMQSKNYLKGYRFEISNIQINQSIDEASVSMLINNPNDIRITGVEIEDAEVSRIIRNVNSNGKTTFAIQVKPTYFYDSYRLTKIFFEEDGISQELAMDTKIEMQFFRSIRNKDDWQHIDRNSLENYRLMKDIDFEDVTDINRDIYINRLEGFDESGSERGFALRNINITGSGNNFGLIHTINSSLYNVNFENVTITNSSSSNKTGIILFEYGNAKKVTFDNVNINADSSSYVGMIAENFSFDTRDIIVKNSTIRGNSNVGGYSGRMKAYGVSNVTISDTKVVGKGAYVGGFVGQQRSASYILQFGITANHVDVSTNANNGSSQYTGGIYGYGIGSNLKLTGDSKVSGRAYVGGISGYAAANSGVVDNVIVEDSKISGSHARVGGALGSTQSVKNSHVYDSTVEGTTANSSYVGGLVGEVRYRWTGPYQITNSSVENRSSGKTMTVTNSGSYTGGICGRGFIDNVYASGVTVSGQNYTGGICGGTANIKNSYVENGSISGNTYVGGAIGTDNGGDWNSVTWSVEGITVDNQTTVRGTQYVGGLIGISKNTSGNKVFNNISSAKRVEATTSDAGGLVGRVEDDEYKNLVGTSWKYYKQQQFYRNIVSVDTITAPTKAGGLIGNLILSVNVNYDGLQTERIYSNIVVANVTTNDTQQGIFIGNGDNLLYVNNTLRGTNLRAYGKSKMTTGTGSNLTVKNVESLTDNIFIRNNSVNLVSLSNLKTNTTYTGLGMSFNYSKLSSNYYPYVAAYSKVILTPLPTETASTNGLDSTLSTPRSRALSTTSSLSYHKLPDYTIYPSDIDVINIEFSDIDDTTSFTLNGQSFPVNQRVFSFYYDFNTPVEFTLTDGINTQNSSYDPDRLRGHLATIDNYYYVLKNDHIITNHSEHTFDAHNLYKNKLLTPDGKIINLINNETIQTSGSNLTLVEQPVPLYRFKNSNTTADVFAKFSVIDNSRIIEQQLLIKGTQTEVISPELKANRWQGIMDSYNSKDYSTVLGEDGVLYNLKNKLTYPENFTNEHIVELSNNIENTTPYMAVIYDDGRVLIFNYRNGNIIEQIKSDTIPTPLEYFLTQVTPSPESTYHEDELMEGLQASEQLSSEIKNGTVASENTAISSTGNYVSAYNPTKNSYDLYDLNELFASPLGANVSVSDQISRDNTLNLAFGHYLTTKAHNSGLSIVVYVGIFVSIVISMVALSELLRKKL